MSEEHPEMSSTRSVAKFFAIKYCYYTFSCIGQVWDNSAKCLLRNIPDLAHLGVSIYSGSNPYPRNKCNRPIVINAKNSRNCHQLQYNTLPRNLNPLPENFPANFLHPCILAITHLSSLTFFSFRPLLWKQKTAFVFILVVRWRQCCIMPLNQEVHSRVYCHY